jgi:hypothetical protein
LSTENVQDQDSEAKIEEIQFDNEDPDYIKQNFMHSIQSGNIAESKVYAEKYEYLTERFNRDIFSELIKCFEGQDKEESCWELFEVLKPSFFDVSRSTTTPLILAVRRNRMELVAALLKMDDVKKIIDKVDEFDRTALMYAAKRGSYFAVKMILQISSESVNIKDFIGKTAIHYACEMSTSHSLDSEKAVIEVPAYLTGAVDKNVTNKLSIVGIMMNYGGLIFPEGPEYKLTSSDVELSEIITEFSGRVVIQVDAMVIVKRIGLGLALTQGLKFLQMNGILNKIDAKLIGFFLSNPLMTLLNDFCYHLMQFFLPGTDANLVFSIDVGNGFQDFSFNLLFVTSMAFAFKYAIENYSKNSK